MSTGATYRVILVDDDKFLLNMYAMKFSQSNFEVQTCLSAKEALNKLRNGYVADALVFDLIMPECDGFQFLEALRDEKLGGSATKIALTNQSTDAEKTKAEELGTDLFIVKATMIPSEVVNTVRTVLEKRKTS